MHPANLLGVQQGIRELVERLDAKPTNSVEISDIKGDLSQLFGLSLKYAKHIRIEYSEESEELKERVKTLQEVGRLLPGSILLRDLLCQIYLNLHKAHYANPHIFSVEDVDRFYKQWTLNGDIINSFGKERDMKQAIGIFDSIDEFLDKIEKDFGSRCIENLDEFLLFTSFFYDNESTNLTEKVGDKQFIKDRIQDYRWDKYQEYKQKAYVLNKEENDELLILEKKRRKIESIKHEYITALKNFISLQKYDRYPFIATRFSTTERIENERLNEWLKKFEELMGIISKRNSQVIDILSKDDEIMIDIAYLERLKTIIEKDESQSAEGVAKCAKYDLSDYTIIRYLGGGGLKEVFEAEHKLQHERGRDRIAIKIYVPTEKGWGILRMRGQDLSETVRSEFDVRQTGNPNINDILTAASDAKAGVIITTEALCQGSINQIDSRIREGGLPFSDAIYNTKQIVNGLYGLSEIGKIHVDLKFPNILIDLSGNLRLTDFGQSPRLLELSRMKDMQNVGYPTTMPPEALCTKNPPHNKTDIWSVGILTYQMITGLEPFPMDFKGTPEEWTRLPMEQRRPLYDQKVKDRIEKLGQEGINKIIDSIPYKEKGEKLIRNILKGCLTIDVNNRYNLGTLKQKIDHIYSYLKKGGKKNGSINLGF